MLDNDSSLQGSISVNLEKIATAVNFLLPMFCIGFGLLGYFVSFYYHFLTVAFFFLTGLNFIYIHVQNNHALLKNFGIIAQMRYMLESVGPEFRQYLFMSDTEEKPFDRVQRSAVYRKAKGVDSSSAFGSLLFFNKSEIKLKHSMFPKDREELIPYSLTLGEERSLANSYTMSKPIMISGMSYGALGANAVRALARGAKKASILMNTGEGGVPKYHLMEGCDLIFQMGTAKFGVRNMDGTLDDSKLQALAQRPEIRVIEIKFSQGAKPGKGGLLPKEKITAEIAKLRGIPMGQDALSPPCHRECTSPEATVAFIRRVQEVSMLPVGVKLCLGNEAELGYLFQEMCRQQVFPDYLSIDGSEGGTGAAPKYFLDDVGVPLFAALPRLRRMLKHEDIQNRFKIFAAGKLIDPGRQFIALSLGAQAFYTARGFMLAIGCIQALQCNRNICPVGITTHDLRLQSGLNIESKSQRVVNYVKAILHEHDELLVAMGKRSVFELGEANLHKDL